MTLAPGRRFDLVRGFGFAGFVVWFTLPWWLSRVVQYDLAMTTEYRRYALH